MKTKMVNQPESKTRPLNEEEMQAVTGGRESTKVPCKVTVPDIAAR